MSSQNQTLQLANELYTALLERKTIPLISQRHPDFTIDDAYAVSLAILDKRLKKGEKLIGKKVGLTSEAIQKILGINEPDFGFLTDAMLYPNAATIPLAEELITPMVEVEIAFVLKSDLTGSKNTGADVLAATDYVVPSFEVVDTRFNTQKIDIVDTVADNASSALFVLGDHKVAPDNIDLAKVGCEIYKNGERVSDGHSSAVMGSPENAVAWLANRLWDYDVRLNAGDIILPGAVAPFIPITAGDSFEARFEGLGSVSLAFS